MRKVFILLLAAATLLTVPAVLRAQASAPSISPTAPGGASAKGPSAPAAQIKIPSVEYLKKWEGASPVFDRETMEERPKGAQFWHDPNVLAMMHQNLPPEIAQKILHGWGQGEDEGAILYDNIRVRGDLLYVSACRPHFCGSESARLYFNLAKKTVQVCWTELDAKTEEQVDYWIDTKTRRLGTDACFRNNYFVGYDAFANKNY